jgi:hypothetical protein
MKTARLCAALLALALQLGAQPLVFEAEAFVVNPEALVRDRSVVDTWNVWSTDKEALAKWSGGVVLQSPRVLADRATPEEGAPALRLRLTGIPAGAYFIDLKYGRGLAVSTDGKAWQRLSEIGGHLGRFEIPAGTFEFWADDRYVEPNSPGSCYLDTITLTRAPVATPKAKVTGYATTRVEERLNRGLVAMPIADGKVYLGWRLLASDPAAIAFNLYRRSGRAAPAKVNDAPLTRTTDAVDGQAPLDQENAWFVKPVLEGKELAASETATLPAKAEVKGYQSFPLQGDYTFQKVGLGDLDGDGQLDYVIKQPGDNIDPAPSYWEKSPDTYKLEAYTGAGRFLWRQDLGWGIERGIWYSPYLVYDFDGDGKAEVAAKTSAGDPRGPDGRVTSGPEYLSIFDGETGTEETRIPWTDRADYGTGMSGYNFASRNQLGLAFLDGKTPCLLVARGTYTVMKVSAYQYRDGALQELWAWDNREETRRPNWAGQGAHFMHCGDVDADGRDEVLLGSCLLDDDGRGLWSTGLGHPDRCFLGDIDPSRPGLEIFYHIEPPQKQNGLCLVEALTGKIIWGLPEQTYHVGSGLAADIDPTVPGQEVWAAEDGKGDPAGRNYGGNPPRWLLSCRGDLLARDEKVPAATAVYWDADSQRELVSGRTIRKYKGAAVAQDIEGGQSFWADVSGDWREELVTSVKGELRLYTTTIPATDRRVCLLQDPIYRIDVAHNAMGYHQPPTLSTFLGQIGPALWLNSAATSLAVGQSEPLTVTLSAPPGVATAGTVTLTADAGLTVTPDAAELRAAPGQLATASFTVALKQAPALLYGGKQYRVSATLGGDLPTTASASFRSEELPLTGVPLVQAETYAEQTGGQVQRRDDKLGAVGQAISHWDSKGHALTWTLSVPAAGTYWLVLRYCAPAGVARDLSLDGAALGQTVFGATGGFGSPTQSDWAHQCFRDKEGQRVNITLTAGEHVITLTNADGKGMNLDYLALVPAQ